ncbi:MAG: restriction endonuclease subunit S [Ardenticatenaceae bacterium]|nr:restriction endonuclease subunit S [Ardenticatenaceae bacterium]
MSNWIKHRTDKLIKNNILAIGDGYRAKNAELGSNGLPFARVGNINDGFHFEDADRFPEKDLSRVGEKISSPGDVVFTSKGTVGRFAFVRPSVEQFVYSPQLCYWRSLDHDCIDPRFLYYWMHGREFWLQVKGVKGQTDMADYVSLRDQRRMFITLPEIDEQKTIAAVLSAFDDKIELNRQMNATLEEIARALFKSWFVDFDPVRRNQEARLFPKSLASAAPYDHLFPDELVVDGNGRELPKGWRIGSMDEVIEINTASIKKDYLNDEIEYIDISSVTEGTLESTTNYRFEEAPSRARRLVKHGDTIWSTVRPNRKSYLFIHSPKKNLVISTGFAVLSPRSIPASYLYSWVTTDEFVNYLVSNASGSAYPAVNAKRFADADILIPNEHVKIVFDQIISPMRDKIAQNEDESRTLADLRDTLLPRLMSGQLRLPIGPEARLLRKETEKSQDQKPGFLTKEPS